MKLTSPSAQQVLLDRVRRGVTHHITRQFAEQVQLDISEPRGRDMLTDALVASLTTEVLAEHLPPHTITTRVRYEHPEAVGQPGTTVDARFERPIDHFTAKYRGRWWGRLLRLRRRQVRYQFVPVPYLVSRPVQCDHVVTTNVRAAWTYPTPNLVLPAEDFGRVVLDARRVDSEASPYGRTFGDDFSDMVRNASRANGHGPEGYR
jgi:hypothetical protein